MRAFPLFLVKNSIVLVMNSIVLVISTDRDYGHTSFDNFGSIDRSRLGSSSFFYTYFQDNPKCSLIIVFGSVEDH